MQSTLFEQLSQALPRSFNFYHLGKVELQAEIVQPHSTPEEGITGFGFQFKGDLNASLILLVEDGLDLSIYAEVGNILASKVANHLFENYQLQVAITPPHKLSRDHLFNFLKNQPPIA